jgi:hypothetical protein
MRIPALLLSSVLLAAGCASDDIRLKPAPSANTVPAPGPAVAATDVVSDVRVTVIPRPWPGEVEIGDALTPLKVRIENDSDKRVLIRFSEIVLVGPDGKTFAALPPAKIDTTVYEPRLAPGYAPLGAPGFIGTGFGVSPLYSPLFPGLPTATGTFYNDPFYYQYYGDYWRSVELPTEAMLALALPEGVLEPDGNVEGYVYFQKVDDDVPRVLFRMDVLNAAKGGVIGEAEIPLIVATR